MKLQKSYTKSGRNGSGQFPLSTLCKALICLVALTPCAGYCKADVQARASTAVCAGSHGNLTGTHVYMLDAQGNMDDVTNSTYYQEPHVYDLYGNLLGTVAYDYTIHNNVGQVIGYISN